MPEKPQNPQFESDVRASFGLIKFMQSVGAEIVALAPGTAEISMPFSPSLTQQAGFVHAGVVAAIADTACGYAAVTLMPPGSDVVSVEFKLNLLAPARGERFIARARVVRAGRTITVCQADVIAVDGGGDVLIATMIGTMMKIVRRDVP